MHKNAQQVVQYKPLEAFITDSCCAIAETYMTMARQYVKVALQARVQVEPVYGFKHVSQD